MNVAQALAETAARLAEKTAVSFENKDITYTELFGKVSKTASVLTALGVRKGDRVVLQLPKSPAVICFYLANLSIGAVTLPLNTGYRHEEIEYFLNDSGSTLFVTDTDNYRDKKPLLQAVPELDCLLVNGNGSETFNFAKEQAKIVTPSQPAYPTGPDDTALICYTSGTTGKPKGAMITHRNLLENAESITSAWQWTENDVLLHVLPLFHVHGLNIALLGSLYAGSTLVMTAGFDPAQVWETIDGGQITMLMGVPTMYHRLMNRWDEVRDKPNLGAMRLFVSGSAPLSDSLFKRFETQTGRTILERYGMTEAGMIATNPFTETERKAGSVGYPFPGVSIRIVDENDAELPGGKIGQIYIKGGNVFKGYWQNPQKTAETFDGDWLKSGDLGYQDPKDGGRLYIVGRGRELIITGGYNVYPKEVETVIDRHENVSESAVFGLADEDFGEKVAAAVVLKDETAETGESGLIELCKKSLAAYKCPKVIFFRKALPRNAMGKIQKQVLQAEHSDA